MNPKEIEILKSTLTNMVRKRSRIKNEDFQVDGRLIGVGFKPYWTNQYDSKLEKLELNIQDNKGRIVPFNFYHVLGYDIKPVDGSGIDEANTISLDIYVFSPTKSNSERNEVNHEKFHLEISSET